MSWLWQRASWDGTPHADRPCAQWDDAAVDLTADPGAWPKLVAPQRAAIGALATGFSLAEDAVAPRAVWGAPARLETKAPGCRFAQPPRMQSAGLLNALDCRDLPGPGVQRELHEALGGQWSSSPVRRAFMV